MKLLVKFATKTTRTHRRQNAHSFQKGRNEQKIASTTIQMEDAGIAGQDSLLWIMALRMYPAKPHLQDTMDADSSNPIRSNAGTATVWLAIMQAAMTTTKKLCANFLFRLLSESTVAHT